MKALFALALMSALAGCATGIAEPQSGERARARFALARSFPGDVVVIRQYDDENCSNERELMRLNNSFSLVTRPRSLGMPLSDYNRFAATEYYLPANESIFVMFNGGVTSVSGLTATDNLCAVLVVAQFEPNTDNELVFDQPVAGGCQVVVNEIVSSADGPRRIQRSISKNFGSQACLEVFRRYRWY